MSALEAVVKARRRRDRAAASQARAEAELAEAIKEARRAGETLQAIASAAGVVRQRVWQIERGL